MHVDSPKLRNLTILFLKTVLFLNLIPIILLLSYMRQYLLLLNYRLYHNQIVVIVFEYINSEVFYTIVVISHHNERIHHYRDIRSLKNLFAIVY
nr:MAG TPA: hypothetical protein [Crassvirales sp.]